ncbi:Ig-like domain-containing protein [Clostridium novyi]|uniref:Ig-like domain-containing protein n=1 Tax=Clostridium novyi TaxID=1542 RepID=UPI0004D71EA7|nr:Ig-like domain-containing protein [Clostridium novyi]KEI08068.1 hypothetical protein Z958_p0150 [Clostridium novyi B str. NCTC 9691]
MEKYSEGLPIANIALGVIIDEVTEKKHVFDTSKKANAKPHLSAGKEDILRVKNRIIAQNETEDIVLGYEIDLEDCTFKPEVFEIIDGGQATESGGYEGAEIGVVCERHPFTLELYSEEKDYDSSTLRYVRFVFKHCKGKPVEFKFEDGKFYIPIYKAKSKPKRKEKPIYLDYVNKLPDLTHQIEHEKIINNTASKIEISEGKKTEKNDDLQVEITSNVKWVFNKQVNQDDVTKSNFIVKKKNGGELVEGDLTIDDTKKIVTFVPKSIEKAATYTAEAKAINKLDSSGKTKAISIEFTTIK